MNTETNGFGNTTPSLWLMAALPDFATTLGDTPRAGYLPDLLISCQCVKGIHKLIGSFIMMMTFLKRMKDFYIAMNLGLF